MRKLKDYSGQFLPELKLSHFSSDILVELLGLYTKLFIAKDAFWGTSLCRRDETVGDATPIRGINAGAL